MVPPDKPLNRINFIFNGRPRILTQNTPEVCAEGEIEECEMDQEDLINQVDQFSQDNSNIDLDEMELPEELGGCTKNSKYTFCPPEHWLAILQLFAWHHALHTLLPEWYGSLWTSRDIYTDSVLEMYTHCK
jgi:hypothetical protein